MTDHDREKFVSAICTIAKGTKGGELDRLAMEAYWLGLSDLNLADVQRGALIALRTLDFMPSVAQLRRLSGELSDEDKAAIAFDELSRAVTEYGSGTSVDFADSTINTVVRRLGGWESVCSKPESTFDTWFRKDFTVEFVRMMNNGVDPHRSARLPGRHERNGGSFKQVTIGTANPHPRLTGPTSQATGMISSLVQKVVVTEPDKLVCRGVPPKRSRIETRLQINAPAPTKTEQAEIDRLEEMLARKQQSFAPEKQAS